MSPDIMGLVALFFISCTLPQVITDMPLFPSNETGITDTEMVNLEGNAKPTKTGEWKEQVLRINERKRSKKLAR